MADLRHDLEDTAKLIADRLKAGGSDESWLLTTLLVDRMEADSITWSLPHTDYDTFVGILGRYTPIRHREPTPEEAAADSAWRVAVLAAARRAAQVAPPHVAERAWTQAARYVMPHVADAGFAEAVAKATAREELRQG